MIKPIETHYKGYRFRSRLEARWAVFFDSLNIKWEYEPEGFNINGICYLPDFHLPELNYWIEIKPQAPDNPDSSKIFLLQEHTQDKCFLFTGQIKLPDDGAYPWATAAYTSFDWPYLWCECQDCGAVGIEFDGRSDRLPCKEKYEHGMINRVIRHRVIKSGCPRHGANLDKGYNYASARLIKAYRNAMSARFEHGETP